MWPRSAQNLQGHQKNTMTAGEKKNLTDKSLKGFYFSAFFSVMGMA